MEIDSAVHAATLLKAMSHQSRLMILRRLMQGTCRAQELQRLLCSDQATVSQHLARFRFGRVIAGKRIGKAIHYEISDESTKQLVQLIDELFFKKADPCIRTVVIHAKSMITGSCDDRL